MHSAYPKSSLHRTLLLRHRHAQKSFAKKHAHAKRFFAAKSLQLDDIRAHSQRLLAAGTIGSSLLLASPALPALQQSKSKVVAPYRHVQAFLEYVNRIPSDHRFRPDEQQLFESSIRQLYGVRVAFALDHNRLPTYVARMGLEQHLYRYPGDNLAQHSELLEAGIAPARGAFGYFVQDGISRATAVANERYYIVLQTFLIPGWSSKWKQLKQWYQFRKFLVINPANGRAVVAVLGDSGPATWTGKRFGGSPEVMRDLGLYPAQTSDDVVVLFLDDPTNEVRLGPVPTI